MSASTRLEARGLGGISLDTVMACLDSEATYCAQHVVNFTFSQTDADPGGFQMFTEGEELLDSIDDMKAWITKTVGEYDALHMPGGLVPRD